MVDDFYQPPDSRKRRLQMLVVYGSVLIGVALTVVIFSIIWLSSKQADHLAVIANFLAFGTLVLALIAGFVALQAYAAATGLPDLQIRADIFMYLISNDRFRGFAYAGHIRGFKSITLSIRNTSSYSARNPIVVVHFNGFVLKDATYSLNERWTLVRGDRDTGAVSTFGNETAFQWDGGPIRSIHGYSARVLPPLPITSLKCVGSSCSLTFELLADGYRRLVKVRTEDHYGGNTMIVLTPEKSSSREWI